ncbi:hypothetical protein [Micromonospora sp. KC723]|uniref:hypothetical protein n=1 Tax=Micromonospora sp. KC723 TaxID=2530381 RepID=UPI00105365F0|nr:hypothetical protein [Micromonospora sp. KC723]TDB73716.1 hypothetical protein E1165_16490 [Micromonospora sp. KC723]
MVDSQHTPARARPAVVTISSYLLILFALLQVISLIIALATAGTIRDVLDDAYRGTAANGAQEVATFAMAFMVGGAVLGLLLAIVLAVLGQFNNRGVNGTRIATWVLGGILFCCCGLNTAGGLANGIGTTGGPSGGDMPSGEEIARRLEEGLPSWYTPVTTLLAVLTLLSLLVALILLALPKANEFFRKPQPAWEPPAPGAAYPGYPTGYPTTPGYPQSGYPTAPGQPGQPAAPGQSQPPAGSEWQAPPPAPAEPPSAPPSGAPDAPSTGQPDPGRPADGSGPSGDSNPPPAR